MELAKSNFPIALTFDIDWAPDFAIRKIVSILEEHNVPGTLFLTHPSIFVESLKDHPLIEFGIHPNFLPRSSHGQSLDEVFDYVLNLCPNTKAIRTHGLFQNSHLYFHILKNYPQIQYDFSLYIPDNPYLTPFTFENEANNSLIRIPYQWEDDLFLLSQANSNKNKPILFDHGSYQIFDFHPIHVYLNSHSLSQYENLKVKIQSSLSCIEEFEAQSYVSERYGVCSQLQTLMTNTTMDRFVFATQIPYLLSHSMDL
ncbi:hypothetical protein Lsha_1440 [Legionella shakespearei DSM 23087]|uniref:Polysaccharide deacetylase n=2 Tax=Legionella shakespearei TaxID=45075 RepID=A0A0W0YVY3_9GAMM|nr:hypothetical protein Lsha_1440 [Legionella shakespearei DSM 23087]